MRILIGSVISLFLLAQTALAQSFNYVDPVIISPEFLTAPVKKGDPKLNEQANVVIKLQSNATESELKKADAEAHLTPKIFLNTFGDLADVKKFPKTNELISKVDSDCHIISDQAKNYWKTERPFQVNSKIQALVKKPNSMAYPSGHTACSRIMAEVLAQVLPKKREALRERAAEIAYHRLIVGVHWPQDIIGGEQLAMLYLGAIQQSDDYQADLKAAIEENAKPVKTSNVNLKQ